MIDKYIPKLHFLIHRQGYNCVIARAYGMWAKPANLHHLCHNTKMHRRMFPLFLNSLWNLAAVNPDWHMKHPSFGKITDLEAGSREAFLLRHPQIASALNMEDADEYLELFSSIDFASWPGGDIGHIDRHRHPNYLSRGRVSRKSAVEAKPKASPAEDDPR